MHWHMRDLPFIFANDGPTEHPVKRRAAMVLILRNKRLEVNGEMGDWAMRLELV